MRVGRHVPPGQKRPRRRRVTEAGEVLDVGGACGVQREHASHSDTRVRRRVCFCSEHWAEAWSKRLPAAGRRLPVAQRTSADISEWAKGFVLREILQRPVLSQKRFGERAMS